MCMLICGAVGALAASIPIYGLPAVVGGTFWLDESGRLVTSIAGLLLGALIGIAVVAIPLGIIGLILSKRWSAK